MTPTVSDRFPDLLPVVCGPTASGKTSLAVRLAHRFDGEIISADSRQVYRGLDIGSGKDLHEYTVEGKPVPYHLIDIADPHEIYTLHHYQHDCYRVLNEIRGRGTLPILCGGTGLYIEAVLRGYSLPEVPENRALRNRLRTCSREELEEMLRGLDTGRLHRTDLSSRKRIIRAIEIVTSGKNEAPDLPTNPPRPSIVPLILCTRFKRAELHERISRRLAARLDEGMIGEVAALRETGVPDERLLMLGMEYRHITLHLRDATDYDTMVENLRRSIFHLAKRQETWFRGMERRGSRDGIPWRFHWVDDADFETAYGIVCKYVPC